MKRIGMLTVLVSLLVAAFCLNCHATDPSADISALERHAERVQAQIEEAKAQNEAKLNAQIAGYKQQVQSYVKQRVEIDSTISKLEAMIEQAKKDSDGSLGRQVQVYNGMMQDIKQQLSSAMGKPKTAGPTTAAPASNLDPKLKKENASARIKTQ
jgi:septal ring factor EnvC (AmiA/AmiB activator)